MIFQSVKEARRNRWVLKGTGTWPLKAKHDLELGPWASEDVIGTVDIIPLKFDWVLKMYLCRRHVLGSFRRGDDSQVFCGDEASGCQLTLKGFRRPFVLSS